jgi:dihydropteroate synthase
MRSKLVGILNVTPDSFSDGNMYIDAKLAINHAINMIEAGVDIIDIGAESTKPIDNNYIAVSKEEEWNRLRFIIPAIIKIAHDSNVLVSIDTRNHDTATKAIDMGVDWINDQSACLDERMTALIASNTHIKLVIMHNLGIPANPQVLIPPDKNVTLEVKNQLTSITTLLEQQGISKERIIIDPGIGFGKNAVQSLQIIKDITEFKNLGHEIMLGYSRKSFLTLFTDLPAHERDLETYAITSFLADKEIEYLRIHDIKGNKRILNVMEGLKNG